jgi:hypothetical protein
MSNRLWPSRIDAATEDLKDKRDIYDNYCWAALGLVADFAVAVDVSPSPNMLEEMDDFIGDFHSDEYVIDGFSRYELNTIRSIAMCDTVKKDPIDGSTAGGEDWMITLEKFRELYRNTGLMTEELLDGQSEARQN